MLPRSQQLLREQCYAGRRTLLLCFFQPLCLQLPSRKWLSGSQLVSSMCEVIDKYVKDFSRVKKPVFTVRVAAGPPSNGCLSVGQGGWAAGYHGRVQDAAQRQPGAGRGAGTQSLLGLPQSKPAQRAPSRRDVQGFPQIQLPSLSLQPGGFPAGCPHGLVLHPAPFPSAFPWAIGV